MEKCKLCGATLNSETGNCDVCDGIVRAPASQKDESPVEEIPVVEKPKKKKR